MAFTSDPARDPAYLPPKTDDILFVNRTNEDNVVAKYTFTYDDSGTSSTVTETASTVNRNQMTKFRMVNRGHDIEALGVKCEIWLEDSDPVTDPADFVLEANGLSGTDNEWIALVTTGLIRVRLGTTTPTMAIVPFAELIKKTGDGIAIKVETA